MKSEDILQKLDPWRQKHRRAAWKPVVEDGDGSPLSSKFGGTPWIGSHGVRPKCNVCKNPLQIFLQLDLNSLPAALNNNFGTGLLQLFYCTNDECGGSGGWEPFGNEVSRIQLIQPTGATSGSSSSDEIRAFPAKRIIGWKEFSDGPSPAEHADPGLKYTYAHKAGTPRLECAELGLLFENIRDDDLAEKITNAQFGDKLGGWPSWVQGVEYPDCPRCGRRMVLVFQLDSEDNLPYMFGDSGCGHITQCSEHKDVVAFGWACC